MTNRKPRRWALALPFVFLHWVPLCGINPASAHPADISHLKVKVEPQRIEFRLTFNLYTLQQFHLLDTDRDGKITKQELELGEQPVRDYIAKHILITINGEDSDLGAARRMERMWPADAASADIVESDFAQRFVDFTFIKTSQPVVDEVWIGFNIFKETGDLHAVQAVFEQDGKPADVSFTRNEPEYLWDTGFADVPEAKLESVAATETSPSPSKSRRTHPFVIVLAIAAIAGTWMLLRKVNRISRGGFRIGPRE